MGVTELFLTYLSRLIGKFRNVFLGKRIDKGQLRGIAQSGSVCLLTIEIIPL
jgi:hypothetical protein